MPKQCYYRWATYYFASSHSCLCGVFQGSVLDLILFIMYSTSLNTLVSSLSLHHFYADNTQLFIFFYPSDLHLTSLTFRTPYNNLLLDDCKSPDSINSSKTEFLLIGLKINEGIEHSFCFLHKKSLKVKVNVDLYSASS